MPARNMKTGAQKCVTQRVKKRAGYVFVRSVGEPPGAKKSRV